MTSLLGKSSVRTLGISLVTLLGIVFAQLSTGISAFADSLSDAASLIGKAAPAFTLKDSNGKSVSLSDFKGKTVVLEWVNFGCPFVKKHYNSGNMQKLQETYTGKGVIWLTICSSAKDKQGYFEGDTLNQEIKAHHVHSTAYLVDADGTVGKEYKAKTTPDMFVVNKDGNIAYAGAIDDQASTDPKDVSGAKNYVKAALDEELKGKMVKTASTTSYGCSIKYAN